MFQTKRTVYGSVKAPIRSAIILLLCSCLPSWASEPYVPSSNDEVLERLPRSLLTNRNELSRLRRRLAENRSDANAASQLAKQYMAIGNTAGDPRFFGYAKAAILPWWEVANPTPDILKLRAKLKEKNHEYGSALADLNSLLKSHPRDIQAWIELSNIYRVQGRYAEAQSACDRLSKFAAPVPLAMCRVPLLVATGHAKEGYQLLSQIWPTAEEKFPGAVPWIFAMQAETARILGRDDAAEQHFKEGLERNPEDTYLMRAYADFLLDRGGEQRVLDLLSNHVSDNGVLLRAAIAAKRIGNESQEWQTQLENRFNEIRLRGNQPHGRFEARYALELKNDPKLALEIATANWEKQKESRDARNVIDAAIGAKAPDAAQSVIEFVLEHGTEDVELRQRIDQLGAR